MKRVLAVLFALLGTALFGLQVDKTELTKGQGANVSFVNYVGPHAKIDTVAQIISIGQSLGARIATGAPDADYFGKYRVIHAVGPAEGSKLDADIFVIEPTAEVDDVVNVIRIVGGYLGAAYGYSADDAALLARFVVYYNAAFRGNLKYFGDVYKTVVMSNITAGNAGIATVYSEWPGKTRMLIPLSAEAQPGNVSAVGAGQLAAPKVIENLQEQPGKGLPDRKAITELQQRQVEQGQKQVETQQAQVAQAEQKQQSEQKALEQSKQQLAQAQSQAAAPGATPEQKQAAAAQASAVAQQEQRVAAASQAVESQKQAVAAEQQQIAQQQQQIQSQRAGIAADEQALIQQKQQQPAAPQAAVQPAVQPAPPGFVVFVYSPPGTPESLGKLVLIDRVSGKLAALSDLNSVRGRAYVTLGGEIVVAAGRTDANGAVRLVALDPTTLSVLQQSDADLAPSSYLTASIDSVYAVVSAGGKAYLGRFDKTLKLQAQSSSEVDPNTYIVVSANEVYVQDSAGNILILNKDDLKEKKRTG